jgi:hypothetical protein
VNKGQIVKAQIIELQPQNQVLVSYQGRLMRVTNLTGQILKVNQILELIVTQSEPLQFKIYSSEKGLNRVV